MTLAELREKRAGLVAEAKTLSGEAAIEPEKRTRFEAIEKEVADLDGQIGRAEKIADWERRTTASPVEGTPDFEAAVQEFSLTRAIASQMPDLAPHVDAGREREVSQELAKRHGSRSGGMIAPMSVFKRKVEERVITSTAPADGPGSNIISTDHRGDLFIDILRARLVTQQRGATVLSGLTGNIDVPRLKASATAGWVAENAALTPSDGKVDKVKMTPKHVGALTEFSRNMLLQSSPDIEALIRADFSAILAEAVDTAAINGGGSNEPEGVLATEGIGSVTVSATPTWAEILEFVEDIESANADQGSLGWVTNPGVVRLLRSTLKVADDAGAGFLMEQPSSLAGFSLTSSTIVPSTLDDGEANLDQSALIFGNWADLMIGYWSSFEVLVNPYADIAYSKGNVQVRGLLTMDTAVRHPKSFTAGQLDT